jgi:hypothetical protein
LALAAAIVVGVGLGGVFARRAHTPPPASRTPVAAAWSTTPAPPATALPTTASPDEKEPHPRHGAKKDAAGKHAHRTVAAAASTETASASSPATEPPPAQATAAPDPPFDYNGTWEGPWTDAEHHQHGRLYLQVGPGANAAGWFSNASVAQSYQVVGRADSTGVYTLTCACPTGQAFTLQATLHDREGDLRGRLTLSAASGVFGQSHVVLKRAPAK